MQVHRVKFF